MDIRNQIESGNAILGIELGSTRIKAVLIGSDHSPIASGDHIWENDLVNGVWTYSLSDAWAGIQDAYKNLAADVMEKYGVQLKNLKGLGVSAMMHGYLPFDKDWNQLCEFRTWRNTMTGEAAGLLTERFSFNIPQRWSIAHLYQAILNGEKHINDIVNLTTLAGFIHYKLSGKNVLGVGEASGMFPIDSAVLDYDKSMAASFDAILAEKNIPWRILDILPKVLNAGEDAGTLTLDGAKLLDPSGVLQPGALMAPPEGDAGTGMAATNSVAVRTGNVSAGTSVFSMVVLEKPLSKVYEEIDMVTTPSGKPVAMVHCNNCTSDINAWANVLKGFADAAGLKVSMGDIYVSIFKSAMEGEKDCGGVVNVNFLSGEHVVGLDAGRPMIVRTPEADMNFANFSRSLVLGAISALKVGMRILEKENVTIDSLLGHGGYFKTPGTSQNLLASALKSPVSVMETAGEGGPWGMALLAAYRVNKENGQSLENYLSDKVFANSKSVTVSPDKEDEEGIDKYTDRFILALAAEKEAVNHIN